jgi:hypothetical protein
MLLRKKSAKKRTKMSASIDDRVIPKEKAETTMVAGAPKHTTSEERAMDALKDASGF